MFLWSKIKRCGPTVSPELKPKAVLERLVPGLQPQPRAGPRFIWWKRVSIKTMIQMKLIRTSHLASVSLLFQTKPQFV